MNYHEEETKMRRVSILATTFGVIGFAMFVLSALALLGAGTAPPTQDLVPALAAVGACFSLGTYAFFAWGVLRTLCEIHKVLTGKLPAEQPN